MAGTGLMRTGRPRRLKLEERIELARRYHAGETPKVLAEAYGVSRRHVTRVAKEQRGEGQEVRDPSVAVSFRAAQSELMAFDATWTLLGFSSRSQALQALVRARCGVLEVSRSDLRDFLEALMVAQDVALAGRGLAKAVSRGKLCLTAEDRTTLLALFELAQKTSRELAGMQAAARARCREGWELPDGCEEAPGGAVSAREGREGDHVV